MYKAVRTRQSSIISLISIKHLGKRKKDSPFNVTAKQNSDINDFITISSKIFTNPFLSVNQNCDSISKLTFVDSIAERLLNLVIQHLSTRLKRSCCCGEVSLWTVVLGQIFHECEFPDALDGFLS